MQIDKCGWLARIETVILRAWRSPICFSLQRVNLRLDKVTKPQDADSGTQTICELRTHVCRNTVFTTYIDVHCICPDIHRLTDIIQLSWLSMNEDC